MISVEDFVRPGQPTNAHWSKAVDQLWKQGVTLASVRAAGESAADYYRLVNNRALEFMYVPRRLLPTPRRVLPMPGSV